MWLSQWLTATVIKKNKCYVNFAIKNQLSLILYLIFYILIIKFSKRIFPQDLIGFVMGAGHVDVYLR